ncbi:hypothetical protein CC78DRAFT_463710 [Lojkania enalia]|uniref:Glycosyltransferase family 34 protein n=1 Tax=Lojkania enalia TaxID=147567 RepID=A0A9P4N3E3_9PLEO|nr:hypothetical protein CC78DRAFT_463710 [Didymosphaeria enalia]
MQAFQVAPRRYVPHVSVTTPALSRATLGSPTISRSIILGVCIVVIFVILFKFFGDVPYEYYRNYGPAEVIAPKEDNNDRPQPGYFKAQPEWNFDVPPSAKGWKGYAKVPRNRDVIVLTASDGGGHNGAIPNVVERVLEDRKAYCEKHGYTNMYINTGRYDIGKSHRTWSKIPAVAEAFYQYPNAEWVWLIDTDIVIMNSEYDLVQEILAPESVKKGILTDFPILDGVIEKNPTNVTTPSEYRVEDVDILVTQDHQSVNTGSIFFRRTAFTRYLLEIMTDTKLMDPAIARAEQDALKHLMLEHQLVRNHVGLYPMRKFDAYANGDDWMGYRDGDLLVHFAGCWTGGKCAMWFDEYWAKRDHKEVWKPVKGEPFKGELNRHWQQPPPSY